jgi:hypothetical protein
MISKNISMATTDHQNRKQKTIACSSFGGGREQISEKEKI